MVGVLRAGQVPTGQTGADALEAANGLIMGLREVGQARDLREVIASANYTANEDELIVKTDEDVTVTLPRFITECGADRLPRNGARVVIAGEQPVTWIYLKKVGWQKVSGLALTDPAPLGEEHFTGLSALLAVHLAPDFDQTPSETTVALAQDGRLALAAAFWREVDVPAAPEFTVMSDMGHGGFLDP